MEYMFYGSPIGMLTIFLEDDAVGRIIFGHHTADGEYNSDPVIGMEIFEELDVYFSGKPCKFNLKIKPEGTEFQRSVWHALLNIPYGETAAYSEIAEKIGKPKAARAVGSACRSNPIPIIIPCHRVVGKNGSLTGYAGGIENKKYLLNLEKTNK